MRKRAIISSIEPASGQIFPRPRSLWTPQAFLKKSCGALVHVEQLAAQPRFLGFAGSRIGGLGQRNPQLLRHHPHGLGEGDVFDLLHEAEDVARHAAAKAVIKLARGMHRKRRRLLSVKRTQSGIVLRAGLLQLDVVADDADDVRLLLDRVREIARVRHFRSRSLRRNCELESG